MRKLIAALLATAATGLASPAFSQVYVDLGAGQAKYSIDCSGALGCEDTDTGFRAGIGYLFVPNLGIELAYLDYGKATVAAFDPFLGTVSGAFSASSVAAYVVAEIPIGDFYLLAKIGAANTKVKLDAAGAGVTVSDSESKTDLASVLGFGYTFTPNISAQFQFSRTRGSYGGEKETIDLMSLGIKATF